MHQSQQRPSKLNTGPGRSSMKYIGNNNRISATAELLKPFAIVMNLLFQYYESTETNIKDATTLIKKSDKLGFNRPSYQTAETNLQTAVANHQELYNELQYFQTKKMPLVYEGTFKL